MFKRNLDFNYFNRMGKSWLSYYWDHNLYKENFKDDDLLKNVIELLLFMKAMEDSRKLWIPQAGLGSQDLEYKMAKIIGDFANKIDK